jgi:putative tryptophan/tyrosine transport system substrate-binding protein
VARPEEIVGAIDIAKSSGAAALNVLAGPLMFNNRQTIVERVAALGLPAMFQSPEIAEYGGFLAYGARLDHSIETFRLANWLCWRVEHE